MTPAAYLRARVASAAPVAAAVDAAARTLRLHSLGPDAVPLAAHAVPARMRKSTAALANFVFLSKKGVAEKTPSFSTCTCTQLQHSNVDEDSTFWSSSWSRICRSS